jgi:hypothetical protein
MANALEELLPRFNVVVDFLVVVVVDGEIADDSLVGVAVDDARLDDDASDDNDEFCVEAKENFFFEPKRQ